MEYLMKNIYLEKNKSINKSMAYFIESYEEDGEDVCDFVKIVLSTNPSITESAFAYSCIKKILFTIYGYGVYSPSKIGESAFENCESLTTVIFGTLGEEETIKEGCNENAKLKNMKLSFVNGDYAVQTNAFKGCGKLTTLVLPKVDDEHTLVIGSDAFCGCGALRTVVAICDKIDFVGNPFADSPKYLTFICKKDSEVAQFARDNGYRTVYID